MAPPTAFASAVPLRLVRQPTALRPSAAAAVAPAAAATGAASRPARAARPHMSADAQADAQASVPSTASHELNGMTIPGPLTPARNYLLVKTAAPPTTTAGGLILTTATAEKPTYGEVLAAGPGAYWPAGGLISMVVAVGETVLFGKYGGTELMYDNAKSTLVTQDDVLCKLEGGAYTADAVVPILDRVFVKKAAAAAESGGGIVLTAGASSTERNTGEVVATGPGRLMENGQTEPLTFGPGATVLFAKFGGTEIKFGADEYVMLRVTDVYAHW